MSSDKNRSFFIRFFLGIASQDEKEAIYNSKESDDMVAGVWEEEITYKNKQEPFRKKELFNKSTAEISSKSKPKPNSFLIHLQKYAAILIVGLLIGGGITYFGIIQPKLLKTNEMVEYYNDSTDPFALELADGSTVVINSQTTVRYPTEFSPKKREVLLDGEAYFKVKHASQKPFMVKTKELTVEVLGTSFNVMAYKNEKVVETTLIEGKVKIERVDPETSKSQRVILTPNHKATFVKSNGRIIMDKVDVKPYRSWIDGKLIFDNDILEDITRKLERKYNTKIILSDDVKNLYRYTLSVENETIEEVLTIFSKTSPVEFSKANGEFLIYSAR